MLNRQRFVRLPSFKKFRGPVRLCVVKHREKGICNWSFSFHVQPLIRCYLIVAVRDFEFEDSTPVPFASPAQSISAVSSFLPPFSSSPSFSQFRIETSTSTGPSLPPSPPSPSDGPIIHNNINNGRYRYLPQLQQPIRQQQQQQPNTRPIHSRRLRFHIRQRFRDSFPFSGRKP